MRGRDQVMQWSYGAYVFTTEAAFRRAIADWSRDVEVIVVLGELATPIEHPGPAHYVQRPLEGTPVGQGLRAALRLDPHVIGVCDEFTAENVELGVNAALTGHLLAVRAEGATLAQALSPWFGFNRELVGSTNLTVVDDADAWFPSPRQAELIRAGATVEAVLAAE